MIEAANRRQPPPLRLIFHVSHCGSTLISRLLQLATPILPLREPGSIQALAAFFRDLGQPLSLVNEARYQQLEQLILQLLARCYSPRQCALIKASSDCSVLASRILDQRQDARATLLYLPLESYLTTMLRSDLRRQETQSSAQSRLADLQQEPGCEEIRIHALDAGQLTAMSWLSNMARLQAAASQHPGRCRLFDFESFLEHSVDTLLEICHCLDLETTPQAIQAALSGPLMQAYSKDPTLRYDRQSRQLELARCQEQFGDQIRSGMVWAEKMIKRAPGLAPLGEFLS